LFGAHDSSLERYHRGDSFRGAQLEPLAIIENLDPKKPSFRPSKWPQKLKTAKNSKLPKLPENCFEPVEKGGWPPISTWIRDVEVLVHSMMITCPRVGAKCYPPYLEITREMMSRVPRVADMEC
jgi:hypothetical protein